MIFSFYQIIRELLALRGRQFLSLLVCFEGLCSPYSNLLGQTLFELDTALVVTLSKEQVNGITKLKGAVSPNGDYALLCTGISHSKREVNLIKLDLKTYSSSLHTLTYPKSMDMDSRITVGKIIWDNDGNVWLVIFDQLMRVDFDKNVLSKTISLPSHYDYVSFDNDYLLLAEYYNYLPFGQAQIDKMYLPTKKIKQTAFPPKHFIGFTHTLRNNLVAVRKNFIVWQSVSKPIVYLYDSNLNLIDSLNYSPDQWHDIDQEMANPDFAKKMRQDVLSASRTALENGVSKNLDVSFVDDSSLVVTWTEGLHTNFQRTLSITGGGLLKFAGDIQVFSRKEIQETKNTHSPFLMGSKWCIGKNLMIEFNYDDGILPWEGDKEKPDLGSVYIECYIYRYIHP